LSIHRKIFEYEHVALINACGIGAKQPVDMLKLGMNYKFAWTGPAAARWLAASRRVNERPFIALSYDGLVLPPLTLDSALRMASAPCAHVIIVEPTPPMTKAIAIISNSSIGVSF
jgi:hypothetical protein